jgi:hypothetical protein
MLRRQSALGAVPRRLLPRRTRSQPS